eukprot:5028727-Prymnesium_polylepis.1
MNLLAGVLRSGATGRLHSGGEKAETTYETALVGVGCPAVSALCEYSRVSPKPHRQIDRSLTRD